MKPRNLLIIVLIVILGVGGFLFYQQFSAASARAAATNRSVGTVTRGNLTATVTVAGNISAPQQTNLSFQLSGVPITKINVKVGDQVKSGDVLAQAVYVLGPGGRSGWPGCALRLAGRSCMRHQRLQPSPIPCRRDKPRRCGAASGSSIRVGLGWEGGSCRAVPLMLCYGGRHECRPSSAYVAGRVPGLGTRAGAALRV